MKVLMLNYEYPPLGGGAANANFYLNKELVKYADLNIELVTSSHGEHRIEDPYPNLRIHFIDIGKRGNLHYQSSFDAIRYYWKGMAYIKSAFDLSSFDLCHAHFGIPSGLMAMRLGLPYIVSLVGSDVPFHNKRFRLLDTIALQRLSKKIWEKACFVVPNSNGLLAGAKKTSSKANYSVIENGVDTEFFAFNENKERRNELRLVSVGRLNPIKGFDLLIKACAGIEDVKITLIGDGPEEENLRSMAQELNVSLDLKGRLEQAEIVNELQENDIYMLTSHNEGMSNAMMEGMACGLPIIGSQVGGIEELVRTNGLTFPPGDLDALRKLLMEAKDMDLHDMRLESRRIAEFKSWKVTADAFYKLYNSCS